MRAPDAAKNEAALVIGKSSRGGGGKWAVLIDASKLVPLDDSTSTGDDIEVYSDLLDACLGMIATRKLNEKWLKPKFYIGTSAAESGWGPMMYEIALGMHYPEYVCSDRYAVSKQAQGVWDHYLNNRPDVDRIFLVDENEWIAGKYEVDDLVPDELMYAIDKRSSLSKVHSDLDFGISELTGPVAEPVVENKQVLQFIKKHLGMKNKRVGDPLTKAEAQAITKAWRTMQLADLKKLGTSYGFRLMAPRTEKQGPALAKLLQNGKALQARYKPIDFENIADGFFHRLYDNY